MKLQKFFSPNTWNRSRVVNPKKNLIRWCILSTDFLWILGHLSAFHQIHMTDLDEKQIHFSTSHLSRLSSPHQSILRKLNYCYYSHFNQLIFLTHTHYIWIIATSSNAKMEPIKLYWRSEFFATTVKIKLISSSRPGPELFESTHHSRGTRNPVYVHMGPAVWSKRMSGWQRQLRSCP